MHIKILSKCVSDRFDTIRITAKFKSTFITFPPALPARSNHTFTSSLPAFLSARRAISCRNAGIRDENWYRSHDEIDNRRSHEYSKYLEISHSTAKVGISRLVLHTYVRRHTWTLSLHGHLFHQHRTLALIVARLYFLYPADLLRFDRLPNFKTSCNFITENIARSRSYVFFSSLGKKLETCVIRRDH